jgi:hypothetical protein
MIRCRIWDVGFRFAPTEIRHPKPEIEDPSVFFPKKVFVGQIVQITLSSEYHFDKIKKGKRLLLVDSNPILVFDFLKVL